MRELAGQNQRTIASVRDQLDALRRTGMATHDPGGRRGRGARPGRRRARPAVRLGGGRLQRRRASSSIGARWWRPASPSTSSSSSTRTTALAPDASFYLADILVQEDKVDDAIAAFEEIPERFPQAEKVPDALYRIGLLQIEKGKKAEARRYLERVVNSYPDSGAAQLAKDRLKELH